MFSDSQAIRTENIAGCFVAFLLTLGSDSQDWIAKMMAHHPIILLRRNMAAIGRVWANVPAKSLFSLSLVGSTYATTVV
jgi:hypothetical protein